MFALYGDFGEVKRSLNFDHKWVKYVNMSFVVPYADPTLNRVHGQREKSDKMVSGALILFKVECLLFRLLGLYLKTNASLQPTIAKVTL